MKDVAELKKAIDSKSFESKSLRLRCAPCRYKCSACASGYFKHKNLCVNKCPFGYIANTALSTCEESKELLIEVKWPSKEFG